MTGIGATSDRSGEIFVLDDEAWKSRATGPDDVTTSLDPFLAEPASWLAVTSVPRWKRYRLEAPLRGEHLDYQLHGMAFRDGMRVTEPFPFAIEGSFHRLRLRVGRSSTFDVRRTYADVRGILVGFYDVSSPASPCGEPSRLHMHVLVPGDEPLVAHVEEITSIEDAVVSLPAIEPSSVPRSPLYPWFDPARPLPTPYSMLASGRAGR